MSFNVLIQAEALFEIKEAFEWYEEQKNGLGFELLEEIESCYDKLRGHPERYPYINQFYRRIKANRFPYLLIYEIEGDDIIINSVRHIRQNPR